MRSMPAALACLIVPALIITASPQASAQSNRELDQRLGRVERVLDQSLLKLAQENESLRQEVRRLRGEIERLDNALAVQAGRSRDIYLDNDNRLGALESQVEALRQSGTDALAPLPGGDGLLDETAVFDETASPSGRGSAASSSSSPSTASSGVFVAEAAARQAASSDGPRPPASPVLEQGTRAATQAEKSSYTRAYDLLARGQNQAAVDAFDGFLREYPVGPYSDNAWYWQGEAHYAERDFDAALQNFAVVVESFPRSPKVPDARLKIGFALYEQQRFPEARAVLTEVQNDYPGRSAAVLARKRLQQMDRENR